MPGRQSTISGAPKKPRAKKQTQKRSLNALAIAEQQNPRKEKIRRNRLGEAEPDNAKRKRDLSDDEDQDLPQKSKRSRPGEKDRFGNEIEGGSDSDGNEWVLGQVASDDDSDLDSDEAMGESDEERFAGFTFRGSSSAAGKVRKGLTKRVAGDAVSTSDIDLDDSEGDEGGDDLGEDAVDLAAMLDASDNEQEERDPGREGKNQDSEDDEFGSDDEELDDQDSALSLSDADDSTQDMAKLSALQTLVSSLDNTDPSARVRRSHIKDAQEAATPSEYGINPRQKLTVADLLPTITDPRLKKSLKLLTEDPKSRKGSDGIPQKLDVPLAKRQQDRLNRAAAYEKSKETLSRWIETVKHNRRAEHLFFPLIDPDALTAKDTKRMLSNTQSKPLTSLESTIQNILIDSGLAPVGGKTQEDQIQAFEELALNKIPIEEVQARRAELRKARELLFREEIRAKRIKKIKSKSYRRVHRRERERNALRESELSAAAGAELSEDEQEKNDRRRAEERMGARHRESKWAKGVKDTGRAAWDEDARSGVTEMARREEELRRRMAGKDVHREEDGSLGSSSSSEEEVFSDDAEDGAGRYTQALKNKLDRLSDNNPLGSSKLASMKFMQNAEAARRERNDADVERLRRDLAGEDSPEESEAEEGSGRRSYGPNTTKPADTAGKQKTSRGEFEERLASDDEENDHREDDAEGEVEIITEPQRNGVGRPPLGNVPPTNRDRKHEPNQTQKPAEPEENPWLSMTFKKMSKRDRRAEISDDVLIDSNPAPTPMPPEPSNPTPNPAPAVKGPQLGQTKRTLVPKPKEKHPKPLPTHSDSDTDSDSASFTGFSSRPSTPPPSNQDLINLAFAGDTVLDSFTAEKTSTALSEAPQTLSTALPGWGTWTGDGISKRELKRNQQAAAKYTTITTSGIDPTKRKDAKLEKVIVNEKRVKKNTRYLATELPFPYESRAQYERALRVPVGPEWVTKETFQGATKPRVLLKQGVIGAMQRPVV
jgi:U3 small nucleolar RNA-associated protein 14